MVPPWVGEHPDVFNDPNFSITPNMSKAEHCGDSQLLDMEVSSGGRGGPAAVNHQATPLVRHPMAHMLGIDTSEIPPVHTPSNEPSNATAENWGLEEPQASDYSFLIIYATICHYIIIVCR